jgi:ferredoxin/truncated hemoglobin YjbI
MSIVFHVSHPQWGTVLVRPGESLLSACLRLGLNTPFSCRGGSCHTCLMRCTDGPVPERARRGLSTAQVDKGCFLPCVCVPEGHMQVAPVRECDVVCPCRIEAVRREPEQLTGQGVDAWVCILEPMGGLPELALGANMSVSLIDPERDADRPQPRLTGQVVALPQTHYFLELRLPAEQVSMNVEALVGQTVWVNPQPPAADEAGLSSTSAHPGRCQLPTDPALWAELDSGKRVRQILDAFYAQVFIDEQLSPFFRGTTREHAAGKQYAFMYQAMTGEDVYFGDNPHNAHHNMVISSHLFDHRQDLMLEILQAHGLSDDQIRRWTAFEEPFRPDIVKNAPVVRFENGQSVTLVEGFGTETLLEGAVCDHCGSIIEPGTTVRYHLRLGTISCPECGAREDGLGAAGG